MKTSSNNSPSQSNLSGPNKTAKSASNTQSPSTQQSTKKQVPFLRQQQRLQKQRIHQIYRQINIQKQKSQRLIKQHEQKVKRVHQKVYAQNNGIVYKQSNQEQIENQEFRQIPVDGQVFLGSRVFQINCAGCHTLESTTNKQDNAPALGLIYNRKVGTDLNYFNYSNSVLQKSFFWSSKNLYNYMANPSQLLPGNKCGLSFKPLKQQSERADLIQFMRQFSKQLQLNMQIQLIKSQGYEMYQTKLYAEKVKKERIQRDLHNPA